MKRATNTMTTTTDASTKNTKYSLQTIASTGTPLTSFQWQQTIGGAGGTTITASPSPVKKQQPHLGAVISSLPPNTIIQAKGTGQVLNANATRTLLQTNGGGTVVTTTGSSPQFKAIATTQGGATVQVRRPTIFIKREQLKSNIRDVTMEFIEKSPHIHLGVHPSRLPIVKTVICEMAAVSLMDCYLTLKKLRQNDEFAVLAQYFELSETEAQQIFARTVARLSRYLRYLIRWPDSKLYYDRHKNMPFQYRKNLSHVQSMIEVVETDIRKPINLDCSTYKYILCISANGIITYVSEAYIGMHDDLAIFKASDFQNTIPKYLAMVAVPGKGVKRNRKLKKSNDHDPNAMETDSTTDSADEVSDTDPNDQLGGNEGMSRYAAARITGELASHQTLSIANNKLTSSHAKDMAVPTTRVLQPEVCRDQIRETIEALREYRILQPNSIQEPLLYQYINEIIVCAAALVNLHR